MSYRAKLDVIGVEFFPNQVKEELSAEFEITFFNTLDEITLRDSTNVWIDLSINVDTHFLAKYPNLRRIICRATSVTNIDMSLTNPAKIEIMSLRGHSAFLNGIPSTAELAWFLVQVSNLPLLDIQSQINLGNWDRSKLIRSELKGKTLGIIGLGRLGRILARYAETFEMNVKFTELPSFRENSKYSRLNLADLCKTSDFLVIAASVQPYNFQILDREALGLCKPSVRIINISRGRLVDESELIKKLKLNEIAFYAADSCKFEDHDATSIDYNNFHELSKLSNVFLTPHIGGYTLEAITSTSEHLAKYLIEGECSCKI
jgi:D-3-phosphoglycerate dehydrogenase / 2-oxoglutarate reductase